MALIIGADKDHYDARPVTGGDIVRHKLKDAQARADIASIRTELQSVEMALYTEAQNVTQWSIGNWSTDNGTAGTNNKRIRSAFDHPIGLNYLIQSESGVVFHVEFYSRNTTSGDYLGWNEEWVSSFDVQKFIDDHSESFSSATVIRITAKTDPEAVLTDVVEQVGAKIHFYEASTDTKLDTYQGTENAGKYMAVRNDGMLVPAAIEVSDSEQYLLDSLTKVVSDNRLDPNQAVTGKLTSEGTVDSTSTSSKTSDYIPVATGDVVRMYRNVDGATGSIYRTATAVYDANKTKLYASTSANNAAFTVSQDGAAYIRVSFAATYNEPMLTINKESSVYKSYFADYYIVSADFITDTAKSILYGRSLSGKKVINFGDSIFGNFRSEIANSSSESISNMVHRMTGAACYNVAFGGTHAKTMSGTARAPMDFQSLVTAIISGTWTSQESYASSQSADYLARVQALEAIDFGEIDVVTVSYGTNDWSSQVTPTQFSDALTDGISRLLAAYPNLVCIVCTPIIRFKHSDDTGDDDAEESGGSSSGTGDIVSSDTIENSSGYKLTQLVEAAETAAKALHCPVCENYWTLGINLQNYTTFMGGMAAADMVHPNKLGRKLIANHLADILVKCYP